MSNGYRNPLAALCEHVMAGVPEWPTKPLGAIGLRPVTAENNTNIMFHI